MCTNYPSNTARPEQPVSKRCKASSKCRGKRSSSRSESQYSEIKPSDTTPTLLEIMADTPDPSGFQQSLLQYHNQISASER